MAVGARPQRRVAAESQHVGHESVTSNPYLSAIVFEDFSKSGSQDGRRFGASVILASLVFGLVGGGIVVASAAVRTAPPAEELVQVEFASPPEPEPPPPQQERPEPEPEPPPPQQERPEPRPRVQREELVQPDAIDDDELEESDADLVEGEGGGPVGGFLDGTPGGTGAAPAPEPEPEPEPEPRRPRGPVMRPENAVGGEMIGGMPPIEYPPAAQSAGVQGMVVVKCAINLRGETERCSVLRGHDVLNEAALRNVQQRRFTPVRLPDGTPIEIWKVFPVRFQLTNM